MASLVVLGLVMIVCGACIGGFLTLSFAIRREDRGAKGALRFDAPNSSTQTARVLVGINSSKWE